MAENAIQFYICEGKILSVKFGLNFNHVWLTGEAITAAKAKSASVWSSISNSQSFISASTKMGTAFGAAKSKVTASFSSQNLSAEAGG